MGRYGGGGEGVGTKLLKVMQSSKLNNHHIINIIFAIMLLFFF